LSTGFSNTIKQMMVLSRLPSALAGAEMGMDKGAVADAMRRTGRPCDPAALKPP
jgi:hypothetical protein